ncbi:MAG: response regulator, partial [Eubacteriales bacterium]
MVYLLEDDASIRELVCYSLNKTGTPATGFDRPSAFRAAVEREVPELVLLDVMLPEEDGLSVLAKLRATARTAKVPV